MGLLAFAGITDFLETGVVKMNQANSIASDEQALIAVCVPTYARPKMLATCLAHIAKAACPHGYRLHLIVVDNDVQGSAAPVFNQARLAMPFDTHYVVESQRGYASVRNRLVQEALNVNAKYVAFIDDDELPPSDWLVHHMEALKTYQADISHAPVIPVAEGKEPDAKELAILNNKSPTDTKKNHVSAGNVVFDIKLVADCGLRFDPFFNQIAGEDHDFFDRAKALGAKFVWVREAAIYEAQAPERQSLQYLVSRRYSGGITNVLKYARSQSRWKTLLHFILKIIGKFFGSLFALVRLEFRKSLLDIITLSGYIAALIFGKNVRPRHF